MKAANVLYVALNEGASSISEARKLIQDLGQESNLQLIPFGDEHYRQIVDTQINVWPFDFALVSTSGTDPLHDYAQALRERIVTSREKPEPTLLIGTCLLFEKDAIDQKKRWKLRESLDHLWALNISEEHRVLMIADIVSLLEFFWQEACPQN